MILSNLHKIPPIFFSFWSKYQIIIDIILKMKDNKLNMIYYLICIM